MEADFIRIRLVIGMEGQTAGPSLARGHISPPPLQEWAVTKKNGRGKDWKSDGGTVSIAIAQTTVFALALLQQPFTTVK